MRPLARFLRDAKSTMHVIHANLTISIISNMLGRVLAIAGLTNPLVTAVLLLFKGLTILLLGFGCRHLIFRYLRWRSTEGPYFYSAPCCDFRWFFVVCVFIWAARIDHFEDLGSPAIRALFEEFPLSEAESLGSTQCMAHESDVPLDTN